MTPARPLPLLLALGLSAAAGTARAEQSEQHSPVLVRLSATAGELSRAHTTALERRLAALLSAWPGIHHAQVQLILPVAAEQPLDRPLPPPRATVVLTRAVDASSSATERPPDQPRKDVVLALVRSAVPTLEPEDLTLREQKAPVAPAPSLGRAPAPRSASATTLTKLRAGLAVSLVVNAVLAAILLWRLRRNRPAAQKVDPPARLPSPP